MTYQWIAPGEHQNGNPDRNYYRRKDEQGHSSNHSFHAGQQPMGARAFGTNAADIRLLSFLFQASWSHGYSGGDTQ